MSAFWVVFFNTASNLMLLLGNTYAARCLGPVNLGVSAQIQALAQQLALLFNGGFDPVSVRMMAAGQVPPAATLRTVLVFRCSLASGLALMWVVTVLSWMPAGPERGAWLLGAPLLLLLALQLSFFFQGIERMRRFAALSALGTLLTVALYAATFHPAMPVGSDLRVVIVAGAATALATLAVSLRLVRLRPLELVSRRHESFLLLKRLLAQSWLFWILAGLTMVYTVLPTLLVGRLQGPEAAGILRACLLLAGGLELVFSSINSLLLPRLVRWLHDEGVAGLWLRQASLFKTYAAGACLLSLLILACAPAVFSRFLGEHFMPGLVPFLLFAASRIVVFVGQIYAWGVVALHLDRQLLLATVCAAVTSLVLNLLLIPHFSVLGAGVAALCAEAVLVILIWLLQRLHVRERLFEPLRSGT